LNIDIGDYHSLVPVTINYYDHKVALIFKNTVYYFEFNIEKFT